MATNTDTEDTGLKLPQEVYSCIAPFCDGNWRNLRLVNKAFEVDATKWLFQELTVCLQYRSLKRLVNISQHDYLAKHVRKLTIGEETVRLLHQAPLAFIYGLERKYLNYPEVSFPETSLCDVNDNTPDPEICYQQYKSVMDNSEFFKLPYPIDLIADIDQLQAFTLYKAEGDLIFNEAKFLARDQDFECLKTALYNFKNLASVHILPLDQGISSSRSWGAFTTVVPHPDSGDDSYGRYPTEDRRLRVFLQVLALVNDLKITELVVKEHLHDEDLLFRDISPSAVDDVHIIAARPSLAHITHLDIPVGKLAGVAGKRGSPNFVYDRRAYKLANMLRSLPLLEHLALRNSDSCNERVRIWPALPAVIPGHLKSILLECCILRPSVLQRFFQDHANTLEQISLNMTYIHLGQMSWLFAEMRQTLNLHSLILISFLVELQSTHDFYPDGPEFVGDSDNPLKDPVDPRRDTARKAISDYVTHQTNVFPSDLLDEHGPFGSGQLPGVVQIIGRADFSVSSRHYDYEIGQAQQGIQEYPDSPVDSYEDREEAINAIMVHEESRRGNSEEKFCKEYIIFATDGSMTGEEELDKELLRLNPGSLGPRIAHEKKNHYRLEGWMI